MVSLYIRCLTDESRWDRFTLDVQQMSRDEERVRLLVSSPGPSTPSSYSSRPAGNAEYSNCKLLLEKIKVSKNSLKVLKVLDNSLEVLKDLKNNLDSLKLQEN
uniref:Uncharacterized protein n=1 Tax=Tanacetum cinerariifolium TaxID=118510 RepID=A0A6L2LUW8_TANCI|nr:hypothetical protein [Tanacetum cinerariifolium]